MATILDFLVLLELNLRVLLPPSRDTTIHAAMISNGNTARSLPTSPRPLQRKVLAHVQTILNDDHGPSADVGGSIRVGHTSPVDFGRRQAGG